MAIRLSKVVAWLCYGLAIFLAASSAITLAFDSPQGNFFVFCATLVAVGLYLFGRAVRFVVG